MVRLLVQIAIYAFVGTSVSGWGTADSEKGELHACVIATASLALKSPLDQLDAGLNNQIGNLHSLAADLDSPNGTPFLSQRLRTITDRNELLVKQTFEIGAQVLDPKKPPFELGPEEQAELRLAYAEALHDLRNLLAPCTALKGFERITPENRDQFREVLLAAEDGMQKAEVILRGLMSGEPIRLRPKTVSSRTLFRDIERLAKGFPPNVKLTWAAGLDLPSIVGDEVALSRALLNLCTNSAKAMRNGGTIELKAELVDASALSVDGSKVTFDHSTTGSGQYLAITVRDNGEGMTEEVRRKIFAAGFTTRAHGEGQGLGLSSTLGIVEKHGGVVSVQSELGKGTQFQVFIPLPAKAASFNQPIPDVIRNSVIVADDQRASLLTMRMAVGKTPFSAVPVESGNLAVATLQKYPDLIKTVILDRHMPGLTLEELIRELRLIKPDLRIIVVSGDAVEAIPGADLVLTKPVSHDQIAELLAVP